MGCNLFLVALHAMALQIAHKEISLSLPPWRTGALVADVQVFPSLQACMEDEWRCRVNGDQDTIPLTNKAWAESGQTKSEPSLSIFIERRGGRFKGMDASK